MGRKDKAPKVDPNKLTEFDRTFYEITINDLNQKLTRLRTRLATLDESNVTLSEKLQEVTESRRDMVAYLERSVETRTDTITELEERLVEIVKVRNRENEQAMQKIKDLEVRYKLMNDQLTSEIKLLNGKLNSLDEFRIQRDGLMAKFVDQEAEIKEKEQQHQEVIYNMEQQALVDKANLRREMEEKLLQVAEQFTRACEIRNAGYTKRLIRENTALQSEINSLSVSQIQMQQQFEEISLKNKEIAEEYNTLDQQKVELIRNSQNKIKIIEKLTEKYERLKAEHEEVVKYRKLYENLATQDVCDRFTVNDLSKKLAVLTQRIESLKSEKKSFDVQQQQKEQENSRLRNVLQQIKSTIQVSITVMEDVKDKQMSSSHDSGGGNEILEASRALRKLHRRNLLQELLHIISTQTEDLPQSTETSVYKTGKIGFLPRSASCLMEIFKRDAYRLVSGDALANDHEEEVEEVKFIPKSRQAEAGAIFDIQVGPSLYSADSHEHTASDHSDDTENVAKPRSSNERSGERLERKISTAQQSVSVGSMDAGSTESDSVSHDSVVSKISQDPSHAESDDDAYSINLFY